MKPAREHYCYRPSTDANAFAAERFHPSESRRASEIAPPAEGLAEALYVLLEEYCKKMEIEYPDENLAQYQPCVLQAKAALKAAGKEQR
jgi:hypothetical protein